MVISIASAPDSWEAKQNPSLLADHMLALLDVGQTPVHLALKPDGGQIFCSNFGSDSVSTIDTEANTSAAPTPSPTSPSSPSSAPTTPPSGCPTSAPTPSTSGASMMAPPRPAQRPHRPRPRRPDLLRRRASSRSPPTPSPAMSPSSAPRIKTAHPSSPSSPPELPQRHRRQSHAGPPRQTLIIHPLRFASLTLALSASSPDTEIHTRPRLAQPASR